MYTAKATRTSGWWAISIVELSGAHTQVRRLDHAETAIRDLLSLLLDRSPDSFEIEVVPELTERESAALDAVSKAKANFAAAQAAMTQRQLEAADLLVHQEGLTVRDAGKILGVSYQRVAQLTRNR